MRFNSIYIYKWFVKKNYSARIHDKHGLVEVSKNLDKYKSEKICWIIKIIICTVYVQV